MVLIGKSRPEVTPVPNNFIDNHMIDAGGDFVKVYIYLLRLVEVGHGDIQISELAARLQLVERVVIRALEHWKDSGLIDIGYNGDQIQRIEFLTDAASSEVPAGSVSDTKKQGAKKSRRVFPQAAPPVGAQAVLNNAADPNVLEGDSRRDMRYNDLRTATENYLGRPLTVTDCELFDNLLEKGFPYDTIEYLVEYCVEKNKKSTPYMRAVAQAWLEDGELDVKKLKKRHRLHTKVNAAVMKEFGLDSIRPAEQEHIDRWVGEYGASVEFIREACGRTIGRCHRPDFNYADSILKGWHSKGIRTKEEILQDDREHVEKVAEARKKTAEKDSKRTDAGSYRPAPNRFHNFKQRDIDYDEMLRKEFEKYGVDRIAKR